jgi:xylose dehydrogenase (NAD/NADP)
MEKVRWGFIGAGMIAKKALYPALLNSEVAEIYAVASRDTERATELSPSGRIYTDYQDLLKDENIEVIYISLPNSLHIPWAIKALQAGKHVLCEKPLAMNATEVRKAIVSRDKMGLRFMEASWNRWHPRTLRIKQLVDSGIIGKVNSIRTAFTYDGLSDENIRAFPELGGGGLYDLGPYSVAAPLWLMDFASHKDIATDVIWHPAGSDETVRTTFTIGSAHVETLTSMNMPDSLYFEIEGENGFIATGGNDAFNSHNQPSTLAVTIAGEKRIEYFAACDPYQLMADAFSRRVRGEDGWLLPLSESLAFAEFFDEIFAVMKNDGRE